MKWTESAYEMCSVDLKESETVFDEKKNGWTQKTKWKFI